MRVVAAVLVLVGSKNAADRKPAGWPSVPVESNDEIGPKHQKWVFGLWLHAVIRVNNDHPSNDDCMAQTRPLPRDGRENHIDEMSGILLTEYGVLEYLVE
jgi:hypothetical protein